MRETQRQSSALTARHRTNLNSPDNLESGQEDFLFLTGRKPDERYRVGFALSEAARQEAYRLRYEIFNLELNEGLEQSHIDGLDRDPFDSQMTHLVLWDHQEHEVVGTYRLQTVTHALARRGLYSSQEFDLKGLEAHFSKLVECGRACIAREHRSFRAVFLLWSGIASFLNVHSHSLLFGCCSLTTQDPEDGWRALKTIQKKKYLHDSIRVETRPGYVCRLPDGNAPPRDCLDREAPVEADESLRLPKLFQAYMALGARVISPPALDRNFGTVDFLVLLDTHSVHMSSLDLVR